MFEKGKNGTTHRPNYLFILALCLTLLAIGGVMGFFMKPPVIAPVANVTVPSDAILLSDETVIVPLNSSTPIRTIKKYSGVITMLVTGTGQVSGLNYGDAFYTYMDAQQQPLTSPTIQHDFSLEIDGISAYNLLYLNSEVLPYSLAHTYLIQYDVGASARRVELRTTDGAVADNTGELRVTILGQGISWQQLDALAHREQHIDTFQAQEGGEALVVPFTSWSPVYTEGLYSGRVTLLIRGTGQADGANYSDAFYKYAQGDQTPFLPPVLGDFTMELDGRPIQNVVSIAQNLPAYASDHVYRVTYDVGSEPRRIGFRNTDLGSGDNRGAYYVEIIAAG